MMIRFLGTRPTPWVIFFIVLIHWNNSPRIDMWPISDTLSWFRANKYLLFLLNAVCLVKNTNTNLIIFGFTQLGLEPKVYAPNFTRIHRQKGILQVFLRVKQRNCLLIWLTFCLHWKKDYNHTVAKYIHMEASIKCGYWNTVKTFSKVSFLFILRENCIY
jgi:hypothetical protein